MSFAQQSNLSLMSLFEVGSQRGGSKSKLNPRLKSRVFAIQKGLCVIDLVQTKDSISKAEEFFYNLGKSKKQILIVGTFDHIKDYVPELSKQFAGSQMPFVNHRWLGGTLTNWATIKKTLKTLEKIEKIESDEDFYKALTRNEKLNLRTQKRRITKFFEGLKNLKNNKPGAVLVLDTYFNSISIKEAQVASVPTVALSNTNSKFLPTSLDKLILCNTNSRSAVELICQQLVKAYNQGLAESSELKTITQKLN
jgi:small subunit ribosomal protein S2